MSYNNKQEVINDINNRSEVKYDLDLIYKKYHYIDRKDVLNMMFITAMLYNRSELDVIETLTKLFKKVKKTILPLYNERTPYHENVNGLFYFQLKKEINNLTANIPAHNLMVTSCIKDIGDHPKDLHFILNKYTDFFLTNVPWHIAIESMIVSPF